MRIHPFCRFLFFLFLFLAASPVQASVERGPQGIIRVGIFHVEPFNLIDNNRIPAGLNVDLLQEISRRQGWTPEFVPVTWEEGLEGLQKEKIDLMVSVAYTQERAEVMDYSHESVAELWGQVFVRPEARTMNINDLAEKRVGIMRKDISGINFIQMAKIFGVDCEFIEYPTHSEIFAAIQQGGADAGVAPQHFGLRHAKEHNLVGSSIMFSPFSIFFTSKKGKQHELLESIDAQLSEWKRDKDSYYYARLNYWLGDHSLRAKIPVWLISASILGAVAVLAFAGFILLLKRTVRLRTEELKGSEEKFRSLAESSRDYITRYDRKGRITYMNPAGLAVFETSEAEVIGKTHKEGGFPEEQSAIWEDTISQVFETGKPYQMQSSWHNSSGPVYLDWHLTPEYDSEGRITSVLGVSRDITERTQLEKIQIFLAETSTGSDDEPFFYVLARFLAENLEMDYVCIDRLEGDGLTARTVAVWSDGQLEDNVSYALKDTPCGEVVGQSICCYPAGVSKFFPNDLLLGELQAESYVGVTLLSHTGSPIGLIAVISRQPLKNRHLAAATLKMVAVRAVGEMERLDAEIALRQSEEQYRLIFNTAQEGIWGMDAMMRTTFVNPRMAAMLGYEPEEMMGRLLEEYFFSDDDLPDHFQRMRERQQGKDDHYQRRFRHKEGHSIWTSVSATALMNNEGTFIGSFGMFTDITESRLAGKRLIENHELLNNLARLVPGVIYQYRLYPDGRSAFPYASPGMNSIYEVTPEEVKEDATPVFGRLHPDDHDRVAETILRSAKTLETFYCEFRVILPRQGLRWRWSQAQPQRMDDGGTLWHGIISDITANKKTEEALRASDEDLRESQRIAHVGSWRLDVASNEVVWSDELYKMYGFDPKLPPPPYTEHHKLFTPESWGRLSDALQNTRETGRPYDLELETLRIDGSHGWMWVHGMAVLDEKGVTVGLRGAAQDITERKQAEEKIRESNEYLENLINYANVPIIVWDMQFRITRFNHAFEEITGRSSDEVKGESIEILFPPNQVEKSMSLIQETLRGERWQEIEISILRRDGSVRTVLWNSAAIRGADGNIPIAIIAQGYDITERKRAEEEKKHLTAQLHQAQKMEAIGTLAGGIAHDFNNILSAILGYAEMIKDDYAADSALVHDIDQVLKAGIRAKELVKQILAFSRQSEAHKLPVQPAAIITEAIKMLRASLPTTILIEQEIDSDAGSILADPTQIHQILMNLSTNAFHAMEKQGGTLTISLHKKSLSEEDLGDKKHMKPGNFVQLSIKDTGAGIAPEIRERIFDPYFTTKEVGKGTGLGLAMVHGIVQSYGGSITCESRIGEGTIFHISLPSADADTLQINASAEIIPVGKEHILFIDDEPMLVEMGKAMLERLGYRVTMETNSIEALTIFRNNPKKFDLMITDQTMPGMTGVDLARLMLQIRPDMPIILCTGYSNLISEEKAKALGIKGFAMKPIIKKDIGNLIRKVLA